jgi:hypothetical protein
MHWSTSTAQATVRGRTSQFRAGQEAGTQQQHCLPLSRLVSDTRAHLPGLEPQCHRKARQGERYPAAGGECPKGDLLCGVPRAHACTARHSITSSLDNPEGCHNGWSDGCSVGCPKGYLIRLPRKLLSRLP